MNRKQKTVVACGLVLVLQCGLFPPWEGRVAVRDTPYLDSWLTRRLGRRFLFSPPTPVDAFEAITGKPGRADLDKAPSQAEQREVRDRLWREGLISPEPNPEPKRIEEKLDSLDSPDKKMNEMSSQTNRRGVPRRAGLPIASLPPEVRRLKSILDEIQVPNSVKSEIWDSYFTSSEALHKSLMRHLSGSEAAKEIWSNQYDTPFPDVVASESDRKRVLREMRLGKLPSDRELSEYRVEVIYREVTLQFLLIVLCVAGLTLLFVDKNGQKMPNTR